MGLAADLDLVALHDLLDGLSDIAQAHIDASLADTRLGRVLDGLEEAVPRRLPREGECRVDDAALDVHAKVDLEHVRLLQHLVVSRVGRVVRSDLVDGQTGREADTALETILLDERAGAVLNHVGNLRHAHARLDVLARVLAHRAVYLSSTADVVVVVRRVAHCQPLLFAHLLASDARRRVVLVLDLLADGEHAVLEDLGQADTGRVRLDRGRLFLFS